MNRLFFVGLLHLATQTGNREHREVEKAAPKKGWDIVSVESRPRLSHKHQVYPEMIATEVFFDEVNDLVGQWRKNDGRPGGKIIKRMALI